VNDTCLACGRTAAFAPTFAGLDRCAGCGFITYRPSTTDFDPTKLYDAEYFAGTEYPDYVGQQRALRRSMRRHLEQMKRYTKLRGALLEVGCAYGFFLDEASHFFDRVTGIDVATDAVAHARDVLRLDAREGDLLTADFGDERFDVACLWDTVEHLAAPNDYLARARDLLHAGGTIFLTTGDVGSLNARLRKEKWRQIHPPTHLHYFSRATMRTMLERLGYEVLGIETAAYYHTIFNVLGTLGLRGGLRGRVATTAQTLLTDRLTTRVGFWVDLRDIMFVAAKKR
jgi:SAM-dependent methyltransferase